MIDSAIQALTAEFNAIRQASLSRDTAISKLDNYFIVILSASLVTYPTLVENGLYIAFPLISIAVASITFTRRLHFRLILKLAEYEELLHSRLVELFRESNESEFLPEPIRELWNWQFFLRQEDLQISKPKRMMKTVIRGGVELTLIIASIGFLVLFIYHKAAVGWSLVEIGIFSGASLYITLLVVAYSDDLASIMTFARRIKTRAEGKVEI